MNRAARSSSTRAPLGQRNVNIENQNHGVVPGPGASSKLSTIILPSKKDVAPTSSFASSSTRSNSLLQRQHSAATTASVTGSETMSSIGGGEANRAFNSLSSETLRNVISSASTSTTVPVEPVPTKLVPLMATKKPLATSSIHHQQSNIVHSSDAPLEKKANSATTVVSKSPSSSEQVTIIEHRKRPCGDGFTVHTYLRGKLLGKGGFAKVYKVTSLDTNKEYAVKIVPKANLVKSRARQKVRGAISYAIFDSCSVV